MNTPPDISHSFFRRNASRIFIIASLIVMAGIGAALWKYFGFGSLRSYSEQAIVFDDSNLRLPANLAGATGRIRVVHFWDPACKNCNEETGAHLSYLTSMYKRANVDFYSVQKPGSTGELAWYLRNKLTPLDHIEGQEHIPASPSVAIWDAEGNLAYAGPYSLGTVCTSANSFVEPVLDKLTNGEKVTPQGGLLAVGCYCPW